MLIQKFDSKYLEIKCVCASVDNFNCEWFYVSSELNDAQYYEWFQLKANAKILSNKSLHRFSVE